MTLSTMSSKFGHASKYYAGNGETESVKNGQHNFIHDNLMRSLPEDCEESVNRAVKQWNMLIRDHLRNETGLKLVVGDERSAIKIVVDDGYPQPFVEMVLKIEPILLELKRRKQALGTTIETLKYVHDKHPAIVKLLPKDGAATPDDTCRTHEFVSDILKNIINKQEKTIDDIIRGIHVDILDAYFFRKSTVHLYWKVIGLFAGLLQVSVQDLTVVVLIHELAHAYSHVGRDIDGKQWETEAFAETDAEIVEGIAQFYTWVVSDKLSDRAPGVKVAFEALLSKQGGSYVAHCGWIEDTARIGEVMRDCMIETRSNGIREVREFSKRVETAGKRFGRKSSQPKKW